MKDKIIERLIGEVRRSRTPYMDRIEYDLSEARISLLEDILLEDYDMSFKEISDIKKEVKLQNMNTYKVWYYTADGEQATIEVGADDLFNLVCKLETTYLYRKQFKSVFKIELIDY